MFDFGESASVKRALTKMSDVLFNISIKEARALKLRTRPDSLGTLLSSQFFMEDFLKQKVSKIVFFLSE